MTDQEIIFKAISEVVNTENPSEFAVHNSTCYTIAKYVCEELREQLSNELAEKHIEKSCEWLKNNGGNSIYYDECDHAFVDIEELVKNFKEAMKDE